MNNLKKILIWIPVIIMAGIIFGFSGQDGNKSSGLSNKVAEIIVNTAEKTKIITNTPKQHKELVKKLQFPIRKAAHMTEYAIFAVLIAIALWVDSFRSSLRFFVAWIFGTIFAMTDEFHQLFVAGRSGQLTDVFIDSVGCIIGLLIYFIIEALYKRKKEKGLDNERT